MVFFFFKGTAPAGMGVSVLSFYYRYRNCFQETLPLLSLKGKSVEIVIFHLWMDKWRLSFSFTNYRLCLCSKYCARIFMGYKRWARQGSCSKGEIYNLVRRKKYLYAKVTITKGAFLSESYEWSKRSTKGIPKVGKRISVKVTGGYHASQHSHLR